MTTLIAGSAYRSMVLGPAVTRAAALLPASVYGALFNIIGGKVLVTSLVGEVVVVMSGTTNLTKITGTPTVGSLVDWTTATATTSAAAGTVITPAVTAGGALVVANGGNAVAPTGYVAQVGTIGVTCSATSATGTVKWTLTYVPIDAGASVTAA